MAEETGSMSMGRDKTIYLDLAIILLLSLVPLLWFRSGYNALAGFDFAVYLDPVSTLRKSMYLWSDLMAGGYDISHEVSSAFYYLLFSVPMLLGASLYTAEKFVFVIIFALQGLGIFYMLRVLFATLPSIRLVSLTGAVLYMFSYPVMAHFGRGNMMTLLTYGLLPLLLGLLFRAYTRPDRRWRYIALIALLSFPIASTKGHPADFIVMIMVALFFTLYQAVLAGRGGARRIIGTAGLIILVTLLVNSWWLVPNIIYITDFGLTETDMVDEGFYNLKLLATYSSGSSFLNTFRNERLDLWFNDPGDVLLNPGIYKSVLFIAIGLLLPALAYISVCVRKRDRNVVFFALLGVTAIFLSKGSHEPFGRVFEWMYMNIPGFMFFRAPYRVFSSLVTFATVPLIAVTLGIVVDFVTRPGRPVGFLDSIKGWPSTLTITPRSLGTIGAALVVITVLSASTIYAWPVFTGSHMKERGTVTVPGIFHVIPDGYAEARRWIGERIGEDENGGKLYYPYQTYDVNTRWGFNGPDPAFELLDVPKIVSRPGGTVYVRYQRPIERLNSSVWRWRYGDLAEVLGIYSARYVLLHEDFNAWVMPRDDFGVYMRSLLVSNGLEPVKNTGQLLFYENRQALERVYSAERGYLLSGDEGAFQALSVAGYMNRPFHVMTRDLGPDELGGVIGSLDGIILFNSNLTDAACEILANRYGARLTNGSLSFNVPKAGRYGVFVRRTDDGGLMSLVDSVVAGGVEGEELSGGYVWKEAAEVELAEGVHTLERKGLWYSSEDADSRDVVVVMPKEALVATVGLLEERLDDPAFEHVYIFDNRSGEAQEESLKGDALNSVYLSGQGGYTIEAARPATGDCVDAKVSVFSLAGIPMTSNDAAGCNGWSRIGEILGSGSFTAQVGAAAEEEYLLMVTRNAPASYAAENLSSKEETKTGTVESRYVAPTLRRVVLDSRADRFVVFNDSHDNGWRLHGKGIERFPVKVNGFANGYLLAGRGGGYSGGDRLEMTGAEGEGGGVTATNVSYHGVAGDENERVVRTKEDSTDEFVLEYMPQRAYRYSMLASIASYGGIILIGWRHRG